MTATWNKQAILFALRAKGTTASALAAKAGISRFTIYSGLESAYPRVHDLISEALGVPRQEIWPQFYDAKGERTGLINGSRAA